jgi:3,4-dihydroxy 2-butanone 4-phosphate synthase/GTP cyclohydrolase II
VNGRPASSGSQVPGDADASWAQVAHTVLAEASLPTRFGRFRVLVARTGSGGPECLVAICGDLSEEDAPMVRLHSECLTGDVFGSLRCDCGQQLEKALMLIAERGTGAVLYLKQEGRGIGLVDKIRAYALQDRGADTVDANVALGLPVDNREYGSAARVLRDVGVHRVRLLTNNPHKCRGLEAHGIEVVERIPLPIEPNPFNAAYLHTKVARMGHLPPDAMPEGEPSPERRSS